MADAKTRAAEYVDAEHRRAHGALKAGNQRSERHELNHHRSRINSIKDNEAVINARFVARSQTIDNKHANMARIIDRQHKSVAGRIDRLLPGGRARQAATWQRLDERRDNLQLRAAHKHHAQLEKHYQHVHQARLSGNRDWVGLRGQNRDYLADHKREHIEHRPNKIHTRMRQMEQAKIVQLRPELKHQFGGQANKPPAQTVQKEGLKRNFPQNANLKNNFRQQANQPPSKTVQNNPMRENLKREFREQANKPPSHTIQRKR